MVNDLSGAFLRGGLLPPCLILALCIYNMSTMSTSNKPSLLVAHRVYTLHNGLE